MSKNLYAKACRCGAVTVAEDRIGGESWSMSKELFKKHFPNMKPENGTYCNCNHCVNHWGIDLCACGSGESPEECENGYDECGTPAQTLGEIKERVLWRS